MKRAPAFPTLALWAAALPLAGCLNVERDNTSENPQASEIVASPVMAGEIPRGSYMMVPAELEQLPAVDRDVSGVRTLAASAPLVFFMNKNGGTYTPGANNASQNRSSIVSQTSVVPPWNVSDASWQEIMTCVRGQFSAYNVIITDVEPAGPHIESVVAGNPQDVGMPSGVGGVSPFRNDCGVIDQSIVFTFAEVFGANNNRVICEVVAQEVAHSFGLDHQFECSDPMTYLNGCGAKSFQARDTQCGEYEPRVCACGQQTQNSVAMLSARIGVAGDGDQIIPTVEIQSPADGAVVPPGFSVAVDAADDVGVTRVELYIDGTLVETDEQAPFSFVTDSALALGTHIIETKAYDAVNVATSSISITLDAEADPIDPTDPNDPTNPSDPTDPNNPNNPSGNGAPSDLVGGCSAGGGGAGGSLLLLLAIGFVFAGRRRVQPHI